MMVAHPDTWIEPMKDAGADQYTFHIEATNNPKETCRKIKESGMKVGIGIKPKTSIEVVEDILSMISWADLCKTMILIAYNSEVLFENEMPRRNLERMFYF